MLHKGVTPPPFEGGGGVLLALERNARKGFGRKPRRAILVICSSVYGGNPGQLCSKRLASWLAVLCLWTAVGAVWPGTVVAEVPTGFEATVELTIPEDQASKNLDGSSGQALPDSQFSVGSADVDDAESGGFWSWLKKQGNTLAKGIGAGVIGAGMVVAGALLLGAGAPLILAGAEFALLGGAIYGATVDPGSFN